MTYYIRYVVTDDKEATLPELEQALQSTNAGYEIDGETVVLDNKEIGRIDVTETGDHLFEGDLELLRGFAEQSRNKDTLLAELRRAKSLVTIQPIWSLGYDETLEVLEPLFDWLLANRAGILADEGGLFYNRAGAIE